MDLPRGDETVDLQYSTDWELYYAASNGELESALNIINLSSNLPLFETTNLYQNDDAVANAIGLSCDIGVLKAIYLKGHPINQKCSDNKTTLEHLEEIITTTNNSQGTLANLNITKSFLIAAEFGFPRPINLKVYNSIALTCKAWAGITTIKSKVSILPIPQECIEIILSFACEHDWKAVLGYYKQRDQNKKQFNI